MTQFTTLGLAGDLMKGIRDAGYDTPTPIQSAAIPAVLAGRDLIGCAQTGTGKTAAFVLPMLDRLHNNPPARRGAVRALVVTPTRELAGQVEDAVRTYGKYTRLRSLAIYGGVSFGPQFSALRRGVDLVVATPGRLLDHVERGTIDLSRVEVLVLDEADRMFDMGFIKDIRKIVAELPTKRQTLLFSATMPGAVQDLANSILTDPERIEIGAQRKAAETVAQQAFSVAHEQKMDLLLHVLQNEPVDHVIVFSRTKHRADRITKNLQREGFDAAVIHSNRSQGQRQKALDGFARGRFRILVATDIAARGIDVDRISHVINYDIPNQAEDYIHRIGRTGRAQTTGDAITFFAHEEERHLRDIERHTGQRIPRFGFDGAEMVPLAEAPRPASRPKRNGRYRGNGNARRRA